MLMLMHTLAHGYNAHNTHAHTHIFATMHTTDLYIYTYICPYLQAASD